MTLQGWPRDPSLSRGTSLGAEPARDRTPPTHARPRGRAAPCARQGRGEGYGGARGGAWAGPGCCAPRQASCRRRLRARSPRLSVSAVAGAVIVAWRCGGSRGCEKAAVARRRWPLEPACKGTAAPGRRLLLDCFFPTAVRCCRVRAAPGGGRLGWQDSGAGAAGECGGAARQPGARAGGARRRLWGSAARARAVRASLGSTLQSAPTRAAPRETCAARRAVSSKARGYQGDGQDL